MRLNWVASSERAGEDSAEGTTCEFICSSRDCLSVLPPFGYRHSPHRQFPQSEQPPGPAVRIPEGLKWNGNKMHEPRIVAPGTRTHMH